MKNNNKLSTGSILAVIVMNACIAIVTSQASDQGQLTFKELGQIDTGGITYRVEVIGGTAYIVDFQLGFKAFDVSNPRNPLELDTLDHPNYYDPDVRGGHSLVIRDDTAIVDFTHGGIKIVNISDPTDLREIGAFYISGVEYYGLIVNSDFVYTVIQHYDERDELLIIDISDITAPIEAGRYSNGHKIFISYVYENIGYVYGEESGQLFCLDVTDPANVTEIGKIDWFPSWFLNDVEIIDSRVYVGTLSQGLRVYDMSDPLDPLLLGQYDSGYVLDIDIVGDLIFAALHDRGFKVFNASGTELMEIGHFNNGGESLDVCVQNGVAYVAEYSTGIEIIQIQGLLDGSSADTMVSPGFDLHFFVFLTIPCLVTIKWKRKKGVL
ncbi:MAG: LVIVD repeat-containing protein [Candidatus Odinarchaeota archaeon]